MEETSDHPIAQLKYQTASGGVHTGAGQLVILAITFGSTPILARLLSPADFGLITMVAAIMGFAQLLSDAGFSAATVQRQEISHQQVSNLFWIACAVGSLLCGAMVLLSPLLAVLYQDPRVTKIAVIWSLSFIASALSIQPLALLRRRMKFGTLAVIDVTSILIATVAAIVVAWFTNSYFALVVGPLTGSLVKTTMAFFTCKFVPAAPRRNAGTRQLINFGANLTGFNALNYFSRNADNILIGKFLGAGSLGVYSKAYALMMLPIRQLNQPLSAVAVPALSRLQDRPIQYRSAYISIMEKLVICSIPLCLLCLFCNKAIVAVLLGPQWASAAPILGILAINGLTQPLSNSTGWLLISQDRTNELFQWGLFSAPIIVCSFLAGIPFGPMGVATSYTITVSLLTIPLLMLVSRKGPVDLKAFALLVQNSIPLAILVATVLFICGRLTESQADSTKLIANSATAAAATLAFLISSKHHRNSLREMKVAFWNAATFSPHQAE